MSAKKIADSINLRNISFAANINIAYLKEISNDYAGAKDIYLENDSLLPALYKDEILLNHKLSNYHALSYAYLKIGKIDSVIYYNNLGYKLSKKSSDKRYPAIFRLIYGINAYNEKDYPAALDSVNKVVKPFLEIGDSLNLAFAYLYIGKIELQKHDTLLAEKKFEKAYEILNNHSTKVPKLGEVYKHLWEINKAQDQKSDELKYLTSYIEFEEAIKSEYQDLYPAIYNELDVPKLVSEKEKMISGLNNKNELKQKGLIILLITIIVVGIIAIYYNIRRRFYKIKFEEIVNSIEVKTSKNKVEKKIQLDGISKEIIDDILEKLSFFEMNNQFLDNNLTLGSLAKKMNTNSSYLSKIVNLNKDENFSKYLNKLRIEYISKELIKNKKMRNFTIKAISSEAGFNNAESFSKSFRENTGMYPSRFLKQLTQKEV